MRTLDIQDGRRGVGTQHRGSAQQNSKHNGPERECAERTEGDIRKCKYSEKSICQNASNIERRNKTKRADRETQVREAEIDACRRDNSNTKRRLETPRKKGRVPLRMTSREVLTPHDNHPKLYSDTVAGGRKRNSNFHSEQRTITPQTK